MRDLLTFLVIQFAMIAISFWEAYSEGDQAWNCGKCGWQLKAGKFVVTGYHFWLFAIMCPAFLSLPFIINGWDTHLFGVVLSSYLVGLIVEDFVWYIVNPKVKFRQWFTEFSDYYPWIKIGERKIIPLFYVVGFIASISVFFSLAR